MADKPAWASKDEMEDAKPEEMMIPGEVIRRKRKAVSKEDEKKAVDEYITLDWEEIFPKKPIDRLRWLFKACKASKEGRIKPNPFFNIIAHRRFIDGLKGAIATDCLNLIRGHLDVFSPKQQKQLTSDNFELFRKYAPIAVLDSDDDEDSAPALPPPPEVIVEMKDKKKKKNQAQKKFDDDDDEEGGSDEDTEFKRAKILAKGVERRIDPSDGQAYTISDFLEQYGGSGDKPPVEWENARHTSFIFKE